MSQILLALQMAMQVGNMLSSGNGKAISPNTKAAVDAAATLALTIAELIKLRTQGGLMTINEQDRIFYAELQIRARYQPEQVRAILNKLDPVFAEGDEA